MNRAVWDEAMDALWNSGVSEGRRRHDGRTCGCPPCGGSCLEGERQKEREETIQSIRGQIARLLKEDPPAIVKVYIEMDEDGHLGIQALPASPEEAVKIATLTNRKPDLKYWLIPKEDG